jgi:hypothetical protein
VGVWGSRPPLQHPPPIMMMGPPPEGPYNGASREDVMSKEVCPARTRTSPPPRAHAHLAWTREVAAESARLLHAPRLCVPESPAKPPHNYRRPVRALFPRAAPCRGRAVGEARGGAGRLVQGRARVISGAGAGQGGGGFFYYPPGHPAHVPGSLPPNVEGQLRSSVHPMERIAPHWYPTHPHPAPAPHW